MGKISQTKKKQTTPKNGASKKSTNKKVEMEVESGEEEQEKEELNNKDKSFENGDNNEKKSTFLNECKEMFGTIDLYAVFNLDKPTATQTEIKRSYYKLSLKYHPDKETDESKKENCKTKFQILGKIYKILSDEEKKKVYDETGEIDGEDDFFKSNIRDWQGYWRQLFKKVTTDDVDNFFENYRDSDEERKDLLGFYEKYLGDMDLILQEMFSSNLLEDEPRFRTIITEAIENGNATEYDAFVKESKKKMNKRKANFEKEAMEAEEMRKEMGIDESQDGLRKAILSRRQNETDSFLNHLAEKYSNGKANEKNNGKKEVKNGKAAKKYEYQRDEEDEEEEEEEDSPNNDSDEDYENSKSKSKSKTKKTTGKLKGKAIQKKVKRL